MEAVLAREFSGEETEGVEGKEGRNLSAHVREKPMR
jgi:hypothetical protein